jgi:triosephosphate isomerase
MREVVIAANWKMHTTPSDAGELARTIAARTREPGVTRVICPPFVCLAAVRDALAERDDAVAVGAQNVHHELTGRVHRRDLGADARGSRDMGDRRALRTATRRW